MMEETAPEGLLAQPAVHCCCGRRNCAFLKHTNNVLEGLEKELFSAAKTGQVCLQKPDLHAVSSNDMEQAVLNHYLW